MPALPQAILAADVLKTHHQIDKELHDLELSDEVQDRLEVDIFGPKEPHEFYWADEVERLLQWRLDKICNQHPVEESDD